MSIYSELLLEIFSDLLDEFLGVKVRISGDIGGSLNEDSKILGHATVFNGFDDGSFELVTEINKLLVVVELSSMEQSSGPSKDGSNGVGGGFLALLMLSVMSGDSTVSGFGFD